jgi:hypothetical protein
MARIRSVFPGLFTDEAFAPLSDAAQILLIGIWTESDDQGVFEWKPARLRIRLRPLKDGSLEPVLVELSSADVIRQFEAAGKQYGACRNFQKYQHPKSPTKVYPLPAELVEYVTGVTVAVTVAGDVTADVTANGGNGHGSAVTDGGMSFPRDATAGERKKRQRARERDGKQNRDDGGNGHGSAVTDTPNGEGVTSQPSPIPENGEVSRQREEIKGKKEESKSAVPAERTLPASPADLEKELFDRGKQVLGKSAGGQIVKLKNAKGGNIALARAAIEQASTKQNPAEYIAAVIKGGAGPPAFGERQTNGFVTRILNRNQDQQHHEPDREPIDVTPNKPAGSGSTEGREKLVERG